MISIEEIDKTILDLENHDTTYSTCEKLAWLYIVKDHLKGNATVTSKFAPNSDFLSICAELPMELVMPVIDEHMEVIKVIVPKEYNVVVEKLKSMM